MSHSWPFVSYQPIRLVYQLYCMSALLARFPLWLVKFGLFRSLRPHREWTLQQAVMARMIRYMVDVQSRIGITESLSLKPGKEKEKFQVVQPAPKSFYKGPLESTVMPTTIGGTWYPKPVSKPTIKPDGCVVLHFHGGAFVIGDGRTDTLGFLANTLVQQGGVDAVFAPQYRLSGYGRSNPFPAALQDALTSYLYLVRTLDIPARNITISGDSAGGNLAIALLRYLADFGDELDIPNPQSSVLLSPWVSPLNSLKPDITILSNPNYSTDLLPPSFTRWGAATYAAIVPPSDPYITPLGNPFATSIPIFVNQGAVEILEIDGTQWVKEMSRVEGNRIQSEYEAAALHDTLLVGERSGWEASAQQVASKVGVFIRNTQKVSEGEFVSIPGKL
ncbi:hypothetical protein JX265_009942 [Neoarthrinium moseri]|uniref:Alpha/beta hydrolase fold-3 domain-containing protein n=1 Tax=Neoarthrinium moseri TaxID=1658444 RepID=A0A9P9WFG4_9PEZI|nr:uncharacterized protein JN550_008583 [Neoarthrinium moseri]KAI1841491.1 hypothetical protein JX266_012331 [Neoarthrinium moseri]KAI1860543.1 hypothetical protein JX265_009942 [Neoarthrinium moseri]KAI1865037.1 hypothetical protein JN550_008583 [Neoarthrinium moseri]